MARPGQLPHSSYGVRTTRQPLVTSLALLTKPQSHTTINQHTQGSLRESFSLGGPQLPTPSAQALMLFLGKPPELLPQRLIGRQRAPASLGR